MRTLTIILALALLVGCTSHQLDTAEAAVLATTQAVAGPGTGDIIAIAPYGELIQLGTLVVAGVALEVIRRLRRANAEKAKAIEQVVKGVDAVLPEKTDQQKLVLEAAQDEATKQIVASVKATVP